MSLGDHHHKNNKSMVNEGSESANGENNSLPDQELQDLVDKSRTKTSTATPAVAQSGNLANPSSTSFTAESGKGDLETYALLFDILDKEPLVNIPFGFSSKLSIAIRRRKNRINDIRFYILISIISLFGLGIAWLSLSMIDKNSAAVMLDLIVTHKWLWLLSLSCVFAIQYIDQFIAIGFRLEKKDV
jgi:hypothetical protein